MQFTKELLEKAKTAGTAEELIELAKAEGMELTAEDAALALARLHKAGELADDELDNVSGGCGDPNSGSGDTPKYKVGDKVYYFRQCLGMTGAPSSKRVDAVVREVREKKYGYFYYKMTDDMVLAEYELYT